MSLNSQQMRCQNCGREKLFRGYGDIPDEMQCEACGGTMEPVEPEDPRDTGETKTVRESVLEQEPCFHEMSEIENGSFTADFKPMETWFGCSSEGMEQLIRSGRICAGVEIIDDDERGLRLRLYFHSILGTRPHYLKKMKKDLVKALPDEDADEVELWWDNAYKQGKFSVAEESRKAVNRRMNTLKSSYVDFDMSEEERDIRLDELRTILSRLHSSQNIVE